jgi:DHA3 family macrolide efflux protein-like MFS transporter
MQGVLAIDVVTAFFAVIPLLFILVPQPDVPTDDAVTSTKSSFWKEMRLGFAYVWSWPGILIMMLLAMMVNFVLTPAIVLLPLLVTQHFAGGAWELSILESTFGIGIIAGGILLSAWGGFKKRVFTTMFGLIGLGIGFTLIGLAPANLYWLAVVGAFLTGGMIALTNGPVRAIFQAAIAPEMQGRVLTLLGSLASAMTPIALILSGPLVDLVGIRPWFIVGGLGTLLVGISGFFIPALLTVEDGRSTTLPLSGEELVSEEIQPQTGVISA